MGHFRAILTEILLFVSWCKSNANWRFLLPFYLKYSAAMNDRSKNCWLRFCLLYSNLSKQIDPNGTNLGHLKLIVFLTINFYFSHTNMKQIWIDSKYFYIRFSCILLMLNLITKCLFIRFVTALGQTGHSFWSVS